MERDASLAAALSDVSSRDYRLFGFYLATMVVCSWPIMNMLGRAIASKGLSYHLLEGGLAVVGLPGAAGFYVLLGLFVGLLTVLVYDSFKRLQTVVLALALTVGALLTFLSRSGDSSPLVFEFSPSAALLGALSVLGAVALGGFRLADVDSDPPRQYPRAALALFGYALVVCLVALFEAHVVYQSPLVATTDGYGTQPFAFEGFVGGMAFFYHASATAVGLFVLYEFTSYERDMNVFLIGPARSGKSALFGGLRAAIQTEVYSGVVMEGDEAGTVDDLSDAIQMGEFPPPTPPHEVRVLTLPFIANALVPERISLQSVDYPGESLRRALRPILGAEEGGRQTVDGGQRLDREVAEGGDEDVDESDPTVLAGIDEADPGEAYGGSDDWEEAVQRVRETDDPAEVPPRVWDCLTFADRVVLVVPMDDFLGPVLSRANAPPYIDVLELDAEVSRDEAVDVAKEEFDYEDLDPNDVKQVQCQGRTFLVTGAKYRRPPEEYLSWYRDLVRELNDEMDFVIVGTVSDLAEEDFRDVNEKPDGTRPFPSTNYDEFCEYAYDELLTDELPMLEQIREGIDDDRIYLTWYEIANEEPPWDEGDRLRIETDKESTVLQGALQLLDRIER